MKRFLSLFLATVLIVFSSLTASAARYVKPVIEVRKWNGRYYATVESGETVSVGDILQLKVLFNQEIDSLSTLRLKIEYSSDTVSYIKSSFTPLLVTNDTAAGEPLLFDKNGVLSVFFAKDDASSKESGEFLSGNAAVGIATFQFVCEEPTDSSTFKAIIDNAISADNKEISLKESYDMFKFKISKWELSAEHKAAFEKLENIAYNEDSLSALQKADEIFQGFSAADKLKFQSLYPELFEYYSTGWTRYYDAGQNATEAQIKAEAERFRETYKDVLALESADDVTTENYLAVKKAISAWNTLKKEMPQVAKELLDEKAKLDILGVKADSIADSIKAAALIAANDADARQWFIERYKDILWILTEDAVNAANLTDADLATISEAFADYDAIEYDAISDSVKAEVDEKYQHLLLIQQWVDAKLGKTAADEKLQKEVDDFTAKWLAVTRLSPFTVGTGDKLALEMYLEDFAKLSEDAQIRLASRKKTVTELLEYVNELIKLDEDSNVVAPGGGTTIETIEKIVETIVEVPGETITETITEMIKVPGETITETITIPGDPITNTEPETIIKTVQVPVTETVTLVETQQVVRQVPLIVYIMIILAFVSILVAAYPVAVYVIKLRKSKR